MTSDTENEIVEKEGRLTLWELGRFIEIIAQKVQGLPRATYEEISLVQDEGLKVLETTMRTNLEKLSAYEEELAQHVERAETAANEQYQKLKTIRDSYARKIADLPEVTVPSVYGYKELISVAEQFSHLDDGQWARVVELAKALRPKS